MAGARNRAAQAAPWLDDERETYDSKPPRPLHSLNKHSTDAPFATDGTAPAHFSSSSHAAHQSPTNKPPQQQQRSRYEQEEPEPLRVGRSSHKPAHNSTAPWAVDKSLETPESTSRAAAQAVSNPDRVVRGGPQPISGAPWEREEAASGKGRRHVDAREDSLKTGWA